MEYVLSIYNQKIQNFIILTNKIVKAFQDGKSGTSNGKNWSMHYVTFENDNISYSTFGQVWKPSFKEVFVPGKEIEVVIETSEKDGKTYHNLKPVTKQAKEASDLLETLKSIKGMLGVLLFYDKDGKPKENAKELKKAYADIIGKL